MLAPVTSYDFGLRHPHRPWVRRPFRGFVEPRFDEIASLPSPGLAAEPLVHYRWHRVLEERSVTRLTD